MRKIIYAIVTLLSSFSQAAENSLFLGNKINITGEYSSLSSSNNYSFMDVSSRNNDFDILRLQNDFNLNFDYNLRDKFLFGIELPIKNRKIVRTYTFKEQRDVFVQKGVGVPLISFGYKWTSSEKFANDLRIKMLNSKSGDAPILNNDGDYVISPQSEPGYYLISNDASVSLPDFVKVGLNLEYTKYFKQTKSDFLQMDYDLLDLTTYIDYKLSSKLRIESSVIYSFITRTSNNWVNTSMKHIDSQIKLKPVYRLNQKLNIFAEYSYLSTFLNDQDVKVQGVGHALALGLNSNF